MEISGFSGISEVALTPWQGGVCTFSNIRLSIWHCNSVGRGLKRDRAYYQWNTVFRV